MAGKNIVIIEDDVFLTVDRYSHLTRNGHDVKVVFNTSTMDYVPTETDRRYLARNGGFNPDNVYFGLEHLDRVMNPEDDSNTVYFCDGLRGTWPKVIEKLGKRPVCLNSGEKRHTDRAQEQGIPAILMDPNIKNLAELLSRFAGERLLH